jgi:hypothetical protein
MNRAIEFHDSTLAGFEKRGEDIVLSFSPAYVHETGGSPGVDAGIGHLQDVEIWILGGSITTTLPEMPVELFDGILVPRGDGLDGLMSLPSERLDPVRLDLTTCTEQLLSFEGSGAKIMATGPSTYLDDFPGMDKP